MNTFGLTFTDLLPLSQREALYNSMLTNSVNNESIEQAAFDEIVQKEDADPEPQDLLF